MTAPSTFGSSGEPRTPAPIEGLDLHHQQAIFDGEHAHLTVRTLRRSSPIRGGEPRSGGGVRAGDHEPPLNLTLIAAPILFALALVLLGN